MRKHAVGAVLAVVIAAGGSVAFADATVVTVAIQDGPVYAVSPGEAAENGVCNASPGAGGYVCTDAEGLNEASVTRIDRCGNTKGSGLCIILGEGGLPNPLPSSTTTLECPNGNAYEVTDGGTGTCNISGNRTEDGTVNCSQAGQSNYSSASCSGGCGSSSGTGKCTVKKL